MGNKVFVSEDIKFEIIKLYKEGLSKDKLTNIYGYSNTVIDRIFKEKGVDFRNNSHKGRRYSLNENYFDEINTNNKAYILGLLYSDGCNYVKQNHIKIELQERDKSILDLINKELDSNRGLYFNPLNSKNKNWQNTYRLDIVNKHMSQQLNTLGMVNNKSLILSFPKYLDEKFYWDFIRGYFDGDGHIEWSSTKSISLASTLDFCTYIKEWLYLRYNIKSSIHNTANKETSTRILYVYSKNNIYNVLNNMYDNSELHIDRKYNLYLQIKNELMNNLKLSA